MRFDHLARFMFTLALVAIVSVASTSCSGGGGNGGGTSADAVVMGISISNLPNNEGDNFVVENSVQNNVPSNVFLNARIVIRLGGSVDPSSLPPAGLANVGSAIEIVSLTSNQAASGVFSLNPADPREVFFEAFPPTSVLPGQGCIAGFRPNETYRISVTSAGPGGSGNVLIVGGNPLQSGAAGTFQTVSCDPGNPSSAFDDTNGADPQVVGQNPPPGTNLLVAAYPGFPTSTVITLDIDESVDPSSVNPSNLVLVNTTINSFMSVPVGGSVSLQQLGSVPGNPTVARLIFTTTDPLDDGHSYEFMFLGVTDLSGNLLAAPAGGTSISTVFENNNTPTSFVEDFTTTNNRGTLTQSIVWPGTVSGDPLSGTLSAIFPVTILGNGLDGVGDFPNSVTINADNQLTPGDPNAQPAVYNFTSLTFGDAGGSSRTISFSSTTNVSPGEANFPVHFRSTGDITVRNFTTVSFDGGVQTQPAGMGVNATTNSVRGGWGGPGGGRGGTGSPINDNMVINLFGDPGEGAHTNMADPTMPGGVIGNVGDIAQSPPVGVVDPYYGGGAPGAAGIDLSSAPNPGPSGGGGGTATSFMGYGSMPPAGNASITFTASTPGETQTGTDGFGSGAPAAGVAGQPMTMMMTPLTFALGGSGGGAGGDRGRMSSGALSYRAGAGGGGGGGAARFSAGGTITFGVLSVVSVKGGRGGSATPPLVAHGGGGSGGSFLAQTFGALVPNPSATFDASGGDIGTPMPPPANPEPPLNGEGGRGGDGIIQLEDGTGGFITTSLGLITVSGEFFTQVFPLAGTITDVARSIAIDTGSNATDFTAASATSSTGSNAMATLSIQLFGIAEDPIAPGTPATTAVSPSGFPLMVGPLSLAQFDQLDGYRYFLFQVTTSYPAPPGVSLGDTLPSVSDITVDYNN